MTLTEAYTFSWIQTLTSLAAVLQTLELLALRKAFSDQGVWAWSEVQKSFALFPRPIQAGLKFFLSYKNFLMVLFFRLTCAVAIFVFPHPVLFLVLFLSTVLICLRWGGTFNGGSDFMTLILLGALLVASIFKGTPYVSRACLWYIAVQTYFSYFISGVVKLKSPTWRSGEALRVFLSSTIYQHGIWMSSLLTRQRLTQICSWAVIGFECTFPLAAFHPKIAIGFISAGLVFHSVNAYVLGLNRFLFAWAAAYPALYYLAGRV